VSQDKSYKLTLKSVAFAFLLTIHGMGRRFAAHFFYKLFAALLLFSGFLITIFVLAGEGPKDKWGNSLNSTSRTFFVLAL